MGIGGKVKKGNGNNRGYIGHHTTWDGKYVFLRSKAEFIYARKLDYNKIPYLLEVITYDVNGVKYKPDFFIYDSNYSNIKAIVEVKGLDDKTTALLYLKNYKKYFDGLEIDYSVVWKQMNTIKKYSLVGEINEWIRTSVEQYDNVSDVSGENNPMYNLKHSDITKNLISKKAKNRCSDVEYLKMMSEVQNKYWNSDEGLNRRQVVSVKRKEYTDKINPVCDVICKNCENTFKKRKNANKEFCSGNCKRNWSYVNVVGYGKHETGTSYKNQLITYVNKILSAYEISFEAYINNIGDITKKAKISGIIPKNKGVTVETLKKYSII